ncbi:MAG: heme-binding protein [Burkholderiales bacterium]
MSKTKTISQLSGAMALAMAAAVSQAQSYGADIGAEVARKVAAGTVAECAKNSWRIAVAVVDTHGYLVYFEKMDDTQIASVAISQAKAKAAATYRRPTRVFADAIAKGNNAIATLPGVIGSPGGIPIVVGGKIIGAVGVSGVTGDQDEQCAKAGVSAL